MLNLFSEITKKLSWMGVVGVFPGSKLKQLLDKLKKVEKVGELPGEVLGKALLPQRLMGRDWRVMMFG